MNSLKKKERSDESKLTLKLDKSNTVRFTKWNEKNNYSIKKNNEDVEQKSVVKYLGLYLDTGIQRSH